MLEFIMLNRFFQSELKRHFIEFNLLKIFKMSKNVILVTEFIFRYHTIKKNCD